MPLKEVKVKIPKFDIPVGTGGAQTGIVDLGEIGENATQAYQLHLKQLEQELSVFAGKEVAGGAIKSEPAYTKTGEIKFSSIKSFNPFFTDNCEKESRIFNEKDLVMKPVIYLTVEGNVPALEIKKVSNNSYLVLHNQDGGLVGKVVESKSVIYNENSLLSFCKAKIKSVEKSGELGYRTAKNKLLGQQMRIEELIKGYKRKNGDVINCITVNSNGRNLKFLLEDIEIIYPDVKGISFPKDREIKKGTMVKCMNSKHTKFQKGELMEVVAVDKTNKIITVNSNGKRYISSIKRFKVV